MGKRIVKLLILMLKSTWLPQMQNKVAHSQLQLHHEHQDQSQACPQQQRKEDPDLMTKRKVLGFLAKKRIDSQWNWNNSLIWKKTWLVLYKASDDHKQITW